MLVEVGEILGKNNFLIDCLITISASNEYICIAKDKNIIIWNIKLSRIISLNEQSHNICCIKFIQIAPIRNIVKHILCLIIGFSSGDVSFISIPSGDILMNQKFHNQPLLQIKSRCFSTIPLVYREDENEDLIFLYNDSILVLIDSEILIEILRDEFNRKIEKKNIPESSKLSFKKYRLKQISGKVYDVITTSYNGIREIKIGSMIICIGNNPMISVYLNSKDGSLISLASDVASKLTSSIYSFAKTWWNSTPSNEIESEIPNPKSHGLSRESKLEDPTRTILSIVQDGTSRLGAFSDNFGRVCLLDLNYSPPLVIRMWKGYREAQLAFFQVSIPNKLNKKLKSFAQYLAIYAPRRGLLEVWKMRNGSRQCVFNVGNNCILLNGCSCYGLDPSKDGIQNCYIFYKNNGKLQKISVDPSLHGISEKSQKQFTLFMETIKKIEDKSFSQQELLNIRKQLQESILCMDGPDQFLMIVQKVLSIAYLQINESQDNIAFPLDYLVTFLNSITNILKDKMNLQSKHHSPSTQVIQQLSQIERINNVIRSIQYISQLNQLYKNYIFSNKQQEEDIDIFKYYLDLDISNIINNNNNNNNDNNNNIYKSFEANILLMNNFDISTGHLKPNNNINTIGIKDIFFQWLLLPQIDNSLDLFLQLFDELLIDTYELQIFFAEWYLSLSLTTLHSITQWKLNENTNSWSLQLFIEKVFLKSFDNDIDPLDPLYHRCADSSHLYNVYLLTKIIMDAYRNTNYNLHRTYLQRWTVLKTNLSTLVNLSTILPSLILSISPLSIASFETTTSIFHYLALLHLISNNNLLLLQNNTIKNDNIDISYIESELKNIFPSHFNMKEEQILLTIHKIEILSTNWIKKIENEDYNSIEPINECIILLHSLQEYPSLQKGIALKLWQSIFIPKIKIILNLIEKVRKPPKQNILIRSTGMNTSLTILFIQSIIELLNILSQLSQKDIPHITHNYTNNQDDIWPPLYDSLYFQLYRIANDTACSFIPIQQHILLITVISLIFKYNIQRIQPLQLFSQSLKFFSSLKNIEITYSDDNSLFIHNERCKFVVSVMINDTEYGLQLTNKFEMELPEILIMSVSWLYSHSRDKEAEDIMNLTTEKIFLSTLTTIVQNRAKILLLQQPYAIEHLSKEAKLWIDKDYINNKDIMYELIEDNEQLQQLRNNIKLLDNILEHIKDYETLEQKEIHQLCKIMQQNSFSQFYEESLFEEESQIINNDNISE